MRFDNITQLFENYSLQTKEEIILGTIINCKNTVKKLGLAKANQVKDNTELINLFESVSGIVIPKQLITDTFNNDQVLNISDYHNNPYAYLSDVKSLMESYIPLESGLNENPEITNFANSLKGYLNDLEKINDFQKFDSMHELVLKTKLFARQPINVYGVNLFDIEKLKNTLKFNLLYSVIYNKSDKQLLFVGDEMVLAYDIKTDKLQEQHLINSDIEQLHVNQNNYLEIIKDEISNNIIEIYKNHEIKPLTFTDNMYGDKKRYEELMEAKEFKKKNSSVLK